MNDHVNHKHLSTVQDVPGRGEARGSTLNPDSGRKARTARYAAIREPCDGTQNRATTAANQWP